MFNFTFISILIFFATAVNVFTAFISWQRRKAKGGNYFAVAMVLLTLWTLAAGLDYAAVPIPLKVSFAQIEVPCYSIGLVLITVCLLLYTGHENWLKNPLVKICFVLYTAFGTLLAWTNDLHHLYWTGFIVSDLKNNIVIFEHGPAFMWIALLGYCVIGIMVAVLLQATFVGTETSRRQARILLLALIVPVSANLLYLFDVFNIPGVDWSSISFSITGLLFLIALYGLRFMDIVPMARSVVLERMNEGIIVLDDRGRLIDFNPPTQAILGITKDDLWTPFHEIALARIPEIVTLLAGQTDKNALEINIGKQVFDIRISPLQDGQGKPYGQLMVMRDITKRNRAEEALRTSEAKLRAVIENSHDGILFLDAQGIISYRSPSYERINGFTSDERQGRDGFEMVHPNDLVRLKQIWDQLLHNPEMQYTSEYRIRHKDGTFRWVESSTRNLLENVDLRSIVIFSRDITKRKQAEEALRESEERFRAVFEQAAVGVALLETRTGRFVRINQAYCDFLGYSQAEMLQKRFQDVTYPDDTQANVDNNARLVDSQIRSFSMEKRYVCKDGTVVWGRLTASSLWKPGETPETYFHIAVVEDITERKRNEGILKIRLALVEFAASHSVDEILQKTLDEIGLVTESPLGFYHFVEPDQDTLSLKAWSTRTLQEFCKAEGEGSHYPIDQEGVWVDCVRERKPVIHNDYTSLPHCKGLPPGHTEVRREVVVPIFRDNRVVAIIGMGNKPIDYDQIDVGIISNVGDVVWEIVKRKQVEESLHQANESLRLYVTEIEQLQVELREQAIHDPLTGLYNRRYLAETLPREIARVKREQGFLSVIVSDIDYFKLINDTHGHQVGDRFLVEIAHVMKTCARESDIVCRYGGEEFLLVIPGATVNDAAKRAEELRHRCSEIIISHAGQALQATLSFGLATFPTHDLDSEQIIIKADRALYQSKNSGRNRVTVWNEHQVWMK